jgi:hypothetical protein
MRRKAISYLVICTACLSQRRIPSITFGLISSNWSAGKAVLTEKRRRRFVSSLDWAGVLKEKPINRLERPANN